MAYQNLNWYTRTYPNFLDDELCDAYVQMFEETLEKDAEEVKKTSICTGPVRPDGHQICGNCNCQDFISSILAFSNFNRSDFSWLSDML